MGGPNDGTTYEGPKEAAAAPVQRAGMGSQNANPNQGTAWDTGGPRPKTVRPVDVLLAGPTKKCPKCEYATRIEPDFEYHTKKIGGLMKCERQRQQFGAVEECGACKGSGETATGVCRTCEGRGKTLSRNTAAPAADADAIARSVTAALAPSLDAIAQGLQALAQKRPSKPRKTKGKGKKSAASRVDRSGAPGAGSAPVADVESEDQSMADPPASASE